MNEFIYRLVPLPGSCRGFILEDPDGDFNIYINQDLSEEQMRDTILHEEMHALRGDTRSDLPVRDLEHKQKKTRHSGHCDGVLAD